MKRSMQVCATLFAAITFSAPLAAAPVLPQTALYTAEAVGTFNGLPSFSATFPLSPGMFANAGMDASTPQSFSAAQSSPGILISVAEAGQDAADYSFSATSSFRGDYVNGAAKSDYTLNFLIGAGYLYAGLTNALVPGAFNQNTWASYSAEILLNGSAIWSSNLKLESQICAAGGFCSVYSMYGGAHPLGATTTGFWGGLVPAATFNPLDFTIPMVWPDDGFMAFYGYQWDENNLSLDLGAMDPFEAFSLEYVMKAKVYGHTDGIGISQAGVLIQDPFGIEGGGFGLEATPLATVPEPPMLALLGLGLFGIAALRRPKSIGYRT